MIELEKTPETRTVVQFVGEALVCPVSSGPVEARCESV